MTTPPKCLGWALHLAKGNSLHHPPSFPTPALSIFPLVPGPSPWHHWSPVPEISQLRKYVGQKAFGDRYHPTCSLVYHQKAQQDASRALYNNGHRYGCRLCTAAQLEKLKPVSREKKHAILGVSKRTEARTTLSYHSTFSSQDLGKNKWPHLSPCFPPHISIKLLQWQSMVTFVQVSSTWIWERHRNKAAWPSGLPSLKLWGFGNHVAGVSYDIISWAVWPP